MPGAFAEHFDFAAAGPQCGGQQVEQTRFASPGRADDGDLFAGANLYVDTAQGVDAIGVAQAALFEAQGHFSSSAARAASSMPL